MVRLGDRDHAAGGGLRRALAAVHALVGVAAVGGGIGLAATGLGMPRDWLLATPFDSWVVPGVLLATVVGGTQLVACWWLAVDDARGRHAAMFAGVVLAGWIVVQWMLLHRFHPLQPVLLVVGVGSVAVADRLPVGPADRPS